MNHLLNSPNHFLFVVEQIICSSNQGLLPINFRKVETTWVKLIQSSEQKIQMKNTVELLEMGIALVDFYLEKKCRIALQARV